MAEPAPAPGGNEPLAPRAGGAEASTVVGTANVHPIPLETVRVDERLQGRLAGVDSKHVKGLVEHSSPEGWQPIVLAQINGENHLVGGFHRVTAAKELGITHLPAHVYSAPDFKAARLAAFEDNKHHGKPPTPEDRKEHARLLAKLHGGLSYREIGRRAGIDHKTAKAAVEGKPQVEVGEIPHPGGSPERPPTRRDPVPSIIKRIDDLLYDGEIEAGDILKYATEHIESFDEPEQRGAANNLATWAEALSEAARPYTVA